MTRPKPEDVAREAPLIAGGTRPGAVPLSEHRAEEPMTDRQAAILRELADRTGEPFDGADLTRAQADQRIAYLRGKLDDK